MNETTTADVQHPRHTGKLHGVRSWTRWTRRVPRFAWLVLAVVALFYSLYFVAANVVLRTGLLRSWLDGEPDKLWVDYESAWSPWPGRVVMQGFTLRFQDDNVQMLLDIDHAKMSIDLFDLMRHTFHVRSLDGEGTSFRMRHKLSHAEGQEGRLAAYPPIPGFPDPPVRKPPPKREIPDSEYRLWTIHLEDIASSIHEVWIMEYHYVGAGSVTGGMRLRPVRELWVAASALVTDGGVLSIGDQTVLEHVDGRLEAQVDPFDVRVPRGTEALRQLTARVDLRGDVATLTPFGRTYLEKTPVTLAGGRGTLRAVGRVDHGLVHPGARIEWRSNAVTVSTSDFAIGGDLAFVGHVDAGKGGAAAALLDPDARPALVAELTVGHARVTAKEGELAGVEDVRAAIRTANDDLTAPFPLSAVHFSVASSRVPDLARLGAKVLPPKVTIRRGSATGSVKASWRSGILDARADVEVADGWVTSPELDVAGHGKAWIAASSKDTSSGLSLGGSGLALDGVALRVKDAHTDGLSLRADLDETLVRTRKPHAIDGTARIVVAPGDRVLALGSALASLPKALGEAPAGPNAQAHVRAHASARGIDVRLLEAKDGDLTARGRVTKPERGDARGAFLVEVGPLRAGIEIADGETHLRPFASREWLDEQTR